MPLGHRRVLNGILYILKHGCPWRSLPTCYGRWNTVYVQMRRWAERGVLAAVFERLRDRGLVASDTGIAMLDSTSVKVHADGTGSLKKKYWRSAKYWPLARRADSSSRANEKFVLAARADDSAANEKFVLAARAEG